MERPGSGAVPENLGGEPAYRRTCEQVSRALQVQPERGLGAAEVAARQARYGPNELRGEPPVPNWRRFLAQFEDSLVVLLLAATAISGGLWLYERDTPLPYESLAILVVVLLNALMGYLQESRAESAVAALRQMTAAQAHVLRSGERRSVAASELVPGDILLVEEGDTVPADARVIEAIALQASEAALTGESVPVAKRTAAIAQEAALGDRDNMLWSGTTVTYGRGRALVVATGMATEMGHIAGMLREVSDDKTPLQKQLDTMGKRLGLGVIGIAVIMVGTIVEVEEIVSFANLLDVFILGVALAVAAVPEGLPAVVTAVLSLGVQRMADRNAVVRHLRAVETLGSANVIASDKTGTLTKNEMTVRELVTADGAVRFGGTGYAPEGEIARADGAGIEAAQRAEIDRALAIAECANNARVTHQTGRWQVQGDPTEGALLVAARKYAAWSSPARASDPAEEGASPQPADARWPRLGEVPFSSERKRMSTVHRDAREPGRLLVFSKGAPDVVLQLCTREQRGDSSQPLTEARREAIVQHNEALAGRGLRTLGVAFREAPQGTVAPELPGASLERDLVFVGLFGIVDPPREEARSAVARAHAAGIRTLMITGDHPTTAAMIANELGMSSEPHVTTGRELRDLTDEQLDRVVQRTSVFARVDPEHKLKIVRALARQGAVVAMTGDGVNDAPALKTADIGVAMGVTGTDVSKQAADMILADDNFATIVVAVEEGRAIFSNIRKFLRYLLSSNIGEVLTMFFGVVLAGPLGLSASASGLVLPLVATQLLWINMVTDGAPALALGVDPADGELMSRPPRPSREAVITPQMWRGILFVGVVMAAVTLYALDASLPGGFVQGTGDLRYGQTMAFNTLMLCQVFNVFNARSDVQSALPRLLTNAWLWAALVASVGAQLLVMYVPALQRAFSTVPLSSRDWLMCTGLASLTLVTRELGKLLVRRCARRGARHMSHGQPAEAP